MVSPMEDEDSGTKNLGRLSVFYYGVGHMLNDITSSCWFTYLLLFLTDIGLSPSLLSLRLTYPLEMLLCLILWTMMSSFKMWEQMDISAKGNLVRTIFIWVIWKTLWCSTANTVTSSRDAAIVMLSGQVADGFATIFAGELIDRFGHFKIWHGAGSVLVAISFSSVFGGCVPCKIFGTHSLFMQTVGYSTFAAIFNIGWAATQVSHMSMVNCITLNATSRVVLASCRNAFTMVANLSLFAVAFTVFSLSKSSTHADVENQYRWIAYISIFVGCCFVAIFLIGNKEPRLKQAIQENGHQRISWVYWFKKVLYYQVALVYMLTRLVTNVSQALLAIYVINDLLMGQSAKALVPAIIYICSFVVSVALQEMTWTGERLKAFFTAGSVLWIVSGTGILVLPSNIHNLMYLLSISIGVANALMMVTCISMQSVLVGEDLNGCAFVYGSLSFLDKMSCGIALYVIESYEGSFSSINSCNSIIGCLSITRYGLGLFPAFCSLLGVVITYSMDLRSTNSKPLMEPLLV